MTNKTNKYTSGITFSANVINGIYTVRFDKVAVSPTIATITTTTTADGVKDFGESPFVIDAEFGRVLTVVASSANTSKVTVSGFDYLGQPVTEEFTLNGTTVVVGKKAFKCISKIVNVKGTASTITVNGGILLGLPYRTAGIIAEVRDGVKASTTTITAPVNTAQTATTSDPRGLANLVTYASAADITLVCLASPEFFVISGKELGGLYGLPHFAG